MKCSQKEVKKIKREKIFEMINFSKEKHKNNSIYAMTIAFFTLVSLIPLACKHAHQFFRITDMICLFVFTVDYILRLVTADLKYESHGISPFLKYIVSFISISDIMAIIPLIVVLNSKFSALRMLRMIQIVRIMRLFNLSGYFKNLNTVIDIFRKSKKMLITVYAVSLTYVVTSALIIFNVEPESFQTFLDAVYWSTISLTTIGYGDIYPVTVLGKILTILSSIIGVAVVALPSGIITAAYINKIRELNNEKSGDQGKKT